MFFLDYSSLNKNYALELSFGLVICVKDIKKMLLPVPTPLVLSVPRLGSLRTKRW